LQTDCKHESGSIPCVRGHVRKRGRTYSIVLDIGTDPATGKRRQQWRSGFRTKKEAEAELARLIH